MKHPPKGERITLPAPPSVEALRIASSFPPADDDDFSARDTIPAPPPSSARVASVDDDAPSTIPGPPPVPALSL